jgi:small subunit ribosomal protein S21
MSRKDEKVNIIITMSEGFPVERALKKFKRLCDQFGVVKEYRKRQAHQKPSIKAKEKRENAEKRRKKTSTKSGFGRKI